MTRLALTQRDTPSLSPEEAIEKMSAEAMRCRDLSHNWDDWYVTRIKGGGFERGLRCLKCTTTRIEYLDHFGRLTGNRRYEYPENYTTKGAGRMDAEFRAAIRLAQLGNAAPEKKSTKRRKVSAAA